MKYFTKLHKTVFLDIFTDIQEFYELTLLDDNKTIQQKTVETLQIASKWEQENSLKINASEVRNISNSTEAVEIFVINCSRLLAAFEIQI